MKLHRPLAFVVLTAVLLSGCQLSDNRLPAMKVNAVFTAAAQTLEAKLTRFPLSTQPALPTTDNPSVNPTPTPLPPAETNTPAPTQAAPTRTFTPAPTDTPTPICDAARFIEDVTIPDGTVLSPGESFTKTWRLKNTGACAWDSSYALVFDVGDQMGGPMSIPLATTVAPGQEVELSVNLHAPDESGSYRSYWRLRNPSGVMLAIANGYKGKSFYVDIKVKGASSQAREFAVTGVEFTVTHSGDCSAGIYNVAAAVRVNGAGEVSYLWKRSDGVDDSSTQGRLTFPTAGSQVINYRWPSGATGLSMILTIQTPKSQDFGPALLNCS